MDAKRLQEVAERAKKVDAAAQAARRRVVLEARERGESLVIERDGQVVHVPASEIKLPGEESTEDEFITQSVAEVSDGSHNGKSP